MGDGSLCSFPFDKFIFFIFSSHQNSCSLLIHTILSTLDITLTSTLLSNSSTSSCTLGQLFFLQLFVFFLCSFSFIAFFSRDDWTCWRGEEPWFWLTKSFRTLPDFFLSIFRNCWKVRIELSIMLISVGASTSQSDSSSWVFSSEPTLN